MKIPLFLSSTFYTTDICIKSYTLLGPCFAYRKERLTGECEVSASVAITKPNNSAIEGQKFASGRASLCHLTTKEDRRVKDAKSISLAISSALRDITRQISNNLRDITRDILRDTEIHRRYTVSRDARLTCVLRRSGKTQVVKRSFLLHAKYIYYRCLFSQTDSSQTGCSRARACHRRRRVNQKNAPFRKLFTLVRWAHSANASLDLGNLRPRSGERPARAPCPTQRVSLSVRRAVVASLSLSRLVERKVTLNYRSCVSLSYLCNTIDGNVVWEPKRRFCRMSTWKYFYIDIVKFGGGRVKLSRKFPRRDINRTDKTYRRENDVSPDNLELFQIERSKFATSCSSVLFHNFSFVISLSLASVCVRVCPYSRGLIRLWSCEKLRNNRWWKLDLWARNGLYLRAIAFEGNAVCCDCNLQGSFNGEIVYFFFLSFSVKFYMRPCREDWWYFWEPLTISINVV